MVDKQLAKQLIRKGYRISDVHLRPNDLIYLRLVMKRRRKTRPITLDGITAKEADVRLTELRELGWAPKRVLRLGAPKASRLGYARSRIG